MRSLVIESIMASVSARLSIIGETSAGEPDQDANSALTELDKGLRSAKVGEQCEAIVRFPRLFEKYPFPILINSACLKLAELFRTGTNFHRVLILKVMQQTQKHLDKILNLDEFVHRLYAVIHSNDPVARALTLRTLGNIASVISERKSIHHSIRNSLDSHDAVEMKAAICATGKFAAQSKSFATNICSKIGEMIQGLATPVEIKLQLLSIFQHMHHDAQTIAQVWKLCTSLLPDYPSQQFIVCTLHTLTELAAASVTHIPEQVNLLISYLKEDGRMCVKISALKDMEKLAKKGAHLWSSANVNELVNYTIETPYISLKCEIFSVMVALAHSVSVDKFDLSAGMLMWADCKVLQLCQDCIFHDNVQLAAISVELLSQIAIHVFQEDIVVQGIDLMQEVSSAIETLLLVICTAEQTSGNLESLLKCFQCAVNICDVSPDMCIQFVDTIGSLIGKTSDVWVVPLCTALCALSNKSAGVVVCWQTELIMKLKEFTSQTHTNPEASKAIGMVCTLLFQTSVDKPWLLQEDGALMNAIDSVDFWSSYRIGRQATRYGHHQFAIKIFSILCNRVSSEHLYFWLVSLSEISQAENCLMSKTVRSNQEIIESVSQAITHYMKAVSALKASTIPQHSLIFQCEYARLRSEVLGAHLQLQLACSCVKTSPPPAIAASVAAATRDELQKCGRVVMQIRKCSRDFKYLADQYGALYQSVFDADPKTLTNIQLLHQACLLIAQAIDKISQHNQGISFPTGEEDILSMEHSKQSLENYQMGEACRKASALIRDFTVNYEERVVSRQETDFLTKISNEIFLIPLCLPRFFFQALQSTSIKLAISPQPKTSGEPIIIQNTSQLSIKVEGVVQHGSRPGLYRKVDKILITVSSQQTRTPQQDSKVFPETFPTTTLSQNVTPHYDYFHAQFLLGFSVAGLHSITIEAAVIDDKESLWKTGPKMSLTVKSYDDSNNQKPAARPAFSSRFQT
ncbi:integrator complex subunit 7 [Trichonephila inaurata madagascariensis]|uniref:Integrator complex subunit 7 n=1 Tax=Trichonephila inaurata madagascariensis TaxID=2747483 RepID=A0A8X7BNX1_9ARAC|nr:integrator complex subunit 7 [Trichonephila inaurata madagascariensis]